MSHLSFDREIFREGPPTIKNLNPLTLSKWRSLSYRNQCTELQSKSVDWFLYDRDLRHKRLKG